jgi:hypothetical protein
LEAGVNAADHPAQDFGQLSSAEIGILHGVAKILLPDECAGEGFVLSIENGRRVWRFQRAGLTFMLHGDVTDATSDSHCVLPTRLLDEVLYLASVQPEARLVLDGGVLRYGRGRHGTEMEMAREAAPVTVPILEFSTSATVSAADLFHSLITTTRRPITRTDERLDEISHVMRVVIDDGSVWTEMDWRGVTAARSRSSIPAVISGPSAWSAVRLYSLARVLGILNELDIFDDPTYAGDWTIATSATARGWVRIASGDMEMLLEPSPYQAEAAIPAIAASLETDLGVDTTIADHSSIELEYLGEQVTCEVFSGNDHRVRFTTPVAVLASNSREPGVALLLEINAFNESHLTCQAFLDDGVIYASHIMLLDSRTIDRTACVVEALVHDVQALRECVRLTGEVDP